MSSDSDREVALMFLLYVIEFRHQLGANIVIECMGCKKMSNASRVQLSY